MLSIFAASRFSGGVERTRAFYDELRSQVQFARKVAIAQRRVVCVHIGATQAQLFYATPAGDACPAAAGVPGPRGDVPFSVQMPSGTGVPATTFQFDPLGRYRAADGTATTMPLVLNVAGEGSYQVSVQHETGYVQ